MASPTLREETSEYQQKSCRGAKLQPVKKSLYHLPIKLKKNKKHLPIKLKETSTIYPNNSRDVYLYIYWVSAYMG